MNDLKRLQPWRPANGTEGRIFMDWQCDNCVHDHQAHIDNPEEGCPIIVKSIRTTDGVTEWWVDIEGTYTVKAYGCDKYEADGCRDRAAVGEETP